MDDPSYKRLLKHKRIVKDLLSGFIAPQRAAGWAGALDFDSLREGPTEEITDELRRRLGDVVWSIDRRDGHGGVQILHVVIEHQSSVDYSMPLRFLNYTSLLYQRLYRDRTKWSKDDTAHPLAARLVAIGGNVQRLKQLHRAAVQVPDLEAFRRLLVEAAECWRLYRDRTKCKDDTAHPLAARLVAIGGNVQRAVASCGGTGAS